MSKEIPAEKRAVLRFFGTDLYELEDTLCPMPGQPEGAMAIFLFKVAYVVCNHIFQIGFALRNAKLDIGEKRAIGEYLDLNLENIEDVP